MKTIRTQTLKDNIYTVRIIFEDYGRKELTPKEEKEIVENFGCKLLFKDIDFSGYYKIENGNVVPTEESNGDLVKLNLNNQEVYLNSSLELEYSVKVDSLSDSVIGEHLTSKNKVAIAMCKLFADKIEKAITKVIDEAIAKTDDFESESEITL